MINNEKNIDIIVSALKAHNIRHIVISPGGTNICFVRKVQKDSFFKCYSVVDVCCNRNLFANRRDCCYFMY